MKTLTTWQPEKETHMTRLVTSDIDWISGNLPEYDMVLEAATGLSLKGLGLAAAELESGTAVDRLMAATRVAVVPVTGNHGIITGFSEAVASILLHLGFGHVVILDPDVVGIARAMDSSADILFMADDRQFIAFCPRERTYVDNDDATAEGFVTGLSRMAGGVTGKQVLVIGCGRIGSAAAASLIRQKAKITLIDRDAGKSRDLIQRLGPVSGGFLFPADDLKAAIRSHAFIVDATDSPDIIHASDITSETCIAAPGMPCGIEPAAKKRLAGRILHDSLQVGVAAMACLSLRKLQRKNENNEQRAS